MSFSLFTVNQARDGLELSENQIANHLSRGMGIDRAKNKSVSILKALGDPGTQLDDYNTALDLLLEKAAIVYKDAYNRLVKIGTPTQAAQEAAKTKASNFMIYEKKILDLEYPLANDIDILATATAKTHVNVGSK